MKKMETSTKQEQKWKQDVVVRGCKWSISLTDEYIVAMVLNFGGCQIK